MRFLSLAAGRTRPRLKPLLVLALLAAVPLLPACMLFMRPPGDLSYGRERTSEGGRYVATIIPAGDSIPKGKLQQWTLRVVAIDSAPVGPATITVDGGMPQHGHGLPTKPVVTGPLESGDYLVEGLKFNMGGWWVVKFRIMTPASADSVVFNLNL